MAFDFPSSPTLGQSYQVTGGPTYVWNGTAWAVLTPGSRFNRTVFTATAGQTSFSVTYVIGAVDVFHNGVKLAPADFTATTGSTIVLISAANAGDTIEIVSYSQVNYTNTVQKTGDTMTGALSVTASIASKTATGGIINMDSTTTGTSNTIGSYANNGAAFSDLNYSAGQHILLTGGTERVRITSAGDVGVGTAAPSYPFHVVKNQPSGVTWVTSQNVTATGAFGAGFLAVAGASAYYTALGQSADGSFAITNANGTHLSLGTSGLERARVTTSGDFCVGTSASGGYKFRVNGSYGSYFTSSAGETVYAVNSGGFAAVYGVGTNGYGVRGDASNYHGAYFTGLFYGAYAITTSSSYGGIAGFAQNNSNYGILGYANAWVVYGAGSAYVSGTYQGSDERLKENIEDLGNSLDKIAQLRAVKFQWKPNTDASINGTYADVGLIAQEAISVLPNIVKEVTAPPLMEGQNATLNQELGTFYTIDYGKLIPYLVDAVQELKTKLDAAEARIAQLEGSN